MKTIYTYHFNNDGIFTCNIKKEEKNFRLKEEKTIESLKHIDNISFDNIKVFKHYIKLSKDNFEIYLRDLDLFIEQGLDQYIPNLYQKIKDALKTYIRAEAKKKQKQNKHFNNKIKVVMAAILASTLITLVSQNVNGEENKISTVEAVYIEQEDTNEINNNEGLEKSFLEAENYIEKNDTSLEQVIEVEEVNNQENVVYLDFEKTNDLVKKEYAFNKYEELANWCGDKWGISPSLVLMILTQESAGKKTNLMQIEWDKWAGKPITAYNFRDGKYESFLLTNTPTEEEKLKYTCITEADLTIPKTNISIGCVLLRKSAEAEDYHILASLQCYNLGIGNMDMIFKKVEEETGMTKEEILSDQTNISFYDYTYLPGKGDPIYLSNVLQFIDDYGDDITFKHLKNGEVVEEKIKVYSSRQSL